MLNAPLLPAVQAVYYHLLPPPRLNVAAQRGLLAMPIAALMTVRLELSLYNLFVVKQMDNGTRQPA